MCLFMVHGAIYWQYDWLVRLFFVVIFLGFLLAYEKKHLITNDAHQITSFASFQHLANHMDGDGNGYGECVSDAVVFLA